MRRRRSRAEWRGLIREWQASGTSAKTFAAKHGLNVGTMKWWNRRLRDESGESDGTLVEVVASSPESPDAGSSGAALKLAVGPEMAMAFAELPSPGYLAEFVRLVAGRSS